MVTMITQSQSEFALHVRAVLGLPLDYIDYGCGASAAYKAKEDTFTPIIEIANDVFTKNSFVRVFGKPQSHVGRRMAVALSFDSKSSQTALEHAKELIKKFSDK
jgi:phosphoribosylglycinamide formyltransferase 2